jgi:hypothetical protein
LGSYTLIELSKGAATEPAAGRGQRIAQTAIPADVERLTAASVQPTPSIQFAEKAGFRKFARFGPISVPKV